VEQAATTAVAQTDGAQGLSDRLQGLVGKPLGSEIADAIRDELGAAFPNDDVRRRTRGSAEDVRAAQRR
jgi:hypothetical protein